MNENAVELREARKHYGAVEALRGVDLAIGRGESVAILGPNGAGKTTAISLMLGLRRPTSGQARLFGMDPGDRRARSRCGVMLQESGVSDVLQVRETVDLFRAYYPNPLSLDRALRMAGLEEQAKVKVGKLSGGQRQRLYYSLAVCGDPDAVFLDEPTVGMDVESRRAFLDGIEEFGRQGRTIVLTTHYLREADELADRIVVIDKGLVIADDTPGRIKSRVAGKKVTFTVMPGLQEADLAGLPYTQLQIDGERVRLLSNEPEAVMSALFRRDLAICDLEVVGADLEDAFIGLTHHTQKEEVLTV
ncbi:MAG TPA: ABC transporter ATP-binding protein [Candidatus Dormibacteraeota bacterium]|nr:ABC transporter ATP-binding protein [Candidatus Dormibacteraeota bacterium]